MSLMLFLATANTQILKYSNTQNTQSQYGIHSEILLQKAIECTRSSTSSG